MTAPRPQPFSETFDRLCSQFVDEPLAVSFRELVGPLPADSNGHRIHPYPARLLRQLPIFVFGCEQMISTGQSIYDPFCGSGTVLAEAMAHGYESWGTDPNPFAALISRVKVTPVDPGSIRTSAARVMRSAAARAAIAGPVDPFLDRWFSPTTRFGLEALRVAIDRHAAEGDRDVMLLSLSLTADRIAHKDRRIPVPVRLEGDLPTISPPTIRAKFSENLEFILERLPQAGTQRAPNPNVFEAQAVSCGSIIETGRAAPPNLILTSPPYGAAQKYIRSSSISLAVLGMASAADFQKFSSRLAGREWLREQDRQQTWPEGLSRVPGVSEMIEKICVVNPMRGSIYRQYFIDMWMSFAAVARVLQPEGHYVLVSSSNTVAGMQIATHEVLAAMLQQLGLHRILSLEDRIAGRALMTRRAKTASTPIQSEVVHIFRKSNDD